MNHCYSYKEKEEWEKICALASCDKDYLFFSTSIYTSKWEVEAQINCFLGYSCLSCCLQFFQWDPAALSTCHIKYKCLILHMKKPKQKTFAWGFIYNVTWLGKYLSQCNVLMSCTSSYAETEARRRQKITEDNRRLIICSSWFCGYRTQVGMHHKCGMSGQKTDLNDC